MDARLYDTRSVVTIYGTVGIRLDYTVGIRLSVLHRIMDNEQGVPVPTLLNCRTSIFVTIVTDELILVQKVRPK